MKKFISTNWYKLMIGCSLLMASFGFMVNSLSPAIANDLQKNESTYNAGYPEGNFVYFIDNGYIYKVKRGFFAKAYETGFDYWESKMYQDFGYTKIKE